MAVLVSLFWEFRGNGVCCKFNSTFHTKNNFQFLIIEPVHFAVVGLKKNEKMLKKDNFPILNINKWMDIDGFLFKIIIKSHKITAPKLNNTVTSKWNCRDSWIEFPIKNEKFVWMRTIWRIRDFLDTTRHCVPIVFANFRLFVLLLAIITIVTIRRQNEFPFWQSHKIKSNRTAKCGRGPRVNQIECFELLVEKFECELEFNNPIDLTKRHCGFKYFQQQTTTLIP